MADIIKIKGKDYAPVAMRIQKFRETYQDVWSIETDLIFDNEQSVVVKAFIRNQEGRVIATGHGSANKGKATVYAGRETEKAETSAIGRALGVLGFGTDDLLDDAEDDNHLADSPTQRKQAPPPAQEGGDFMDTPARAELSFVFVELKQDKKGEGYLVYQAEKDNTVKVNVFKRQRGMFEKVGLASTDNLPKNFVGTVERTEDGKFWNLTNVASFQ